MIAQLVVAALGVWLMVAADVLGYGGAAAVCDRIVGPLVASVALTAAWAVTRSLRWLNFPLGLCLVAAPWLFGHNDLAGANSIVTGGLIAGFSLLHGRIRHEIGGGWAALRRSRPSF